MKLLTLDLGVTTGWCVFKDDGTLEANGTLFYMHEEQMVKAFTDLLAHMPSKYVIEAPTIIFKSPLGKKLQGVISAAGRVFKQSAEWVEPTDWKDSIYSKEPAPKGVTQHERDAYRMGLWWLNTRGTLANVSSDT